MPILLLKHFLILSLDYLSYQISNKLNELKIDNTKENFFLKLTEIQNGLNFCKERIKIINNLYFIDAPINLENNLIAKLNNKGKDNRN